jgi:hypothetical protein
VGVAIRYSNHTRVAYPVGNREDAEQAILLGRLNPLPTTPTCSF